MATTRSPLPRPGGSPPHRGSPRLSIASPVAKKKRLRGVLNSSSVFLALSTLVGVCLLVNVHNASVLRVAHDQVKAPGGGQRDDSNKSGGDVSSKRRLEAPRRSKRHQTRLAGQHDPAESGGLGGGEEAVPFYLHGKYRFFAEGAAPPHESRRDLLRRMSRDPTEVVASNSTSIHTWVLVKPLQHPTRNHDSVVVEDVDPATAEERMVVYNILGRHSRYVQSLDMLSGKRASVQTEGEADPAGRPLDDLNHVSAVLVDGVEESKAAGSVGWKKSGRKEIWIPCGFHGDTVNGETSSDYARIVDADTMRTRVGPKLPHSGGACVATALAIIPAEPPMICAFAGTRGTHDAGIFLPHTMCYDRLRGKWWDPFGPLPYGLDHGSLTVVPPGTCSPSDPARILVFNFRTRPYGDSHSEILGYDLPSDGWTPEELEGLDRHKLTRTPDKSEWYLYHNITDLSDPVNEPRDASGVVAANNGRTVLNFGGTAHRIEPATGKRRKVRFSMIRALDVCQKRWEIVGDLGLQTFALQSCGSSRGNVAITCGGEAPLHESNSPLCFVSRWEGVHTIDDQHAPIPFKRLSQHDGVSNELGASDRIGKHSEVAVA